MPVPIKTMIPSTSRITRLLNLLLASYVSLAVLYTTHHFFIAPFSRSFGFRSAPHHLQDPIWLSLFKEPFHAHSSPPIIAPSSSRGPLIHWTSHSNVDVTTPEALFLSKTFSASMQPSTTVPFFYRATGSRDFEFEENDVTITTLITADRFPVFKRLVDTYTGPISVTIHTLPSALPALLPLLHALYTSAPAFPERVDVHLVVDAFPRQFNTWRNAARLWARTKWVMMLDVDFALCTDFRAAIRGSANSGERGGLLVGEGRRILDAGGGLVIPAFEYTRASEGANASTFPTDKPTLLNLVRTHRIGPFHASWAAGHAATLYLSFYAALSGTMYPVPVDRYEAAYEPYVVFNRFWVPPAPTSLPTSVDVGEGRGGEMAETSPRTEGKGVGVRCDERFAGYGGNKAACVYEHWLAGGGLWVLADHWVVHQSHVYKEGARRVERKSNRRLSSDFREDACVRWLHRHLLSGTLHTPRGRSAFGECARVRGVARIGAQIIDRML